MKTQIYYRVIKFINTDIYYVCKSTIDKQDVDMEELYLVAKSGRFVQYDLMRLKDYYFDSSRQAISVLKHNVKNLKKLYFNHLFYNDEIVFTYKNEN